MKSNDASHSESRKIPSKTSALKGILGTNLEMLTASKHARLELVDASKRPRGEDTVSVLNLPSNSRLIPLMNLDGKKPSALLNNRQPIPKIEPVGSVFGSRLIAMISEQRSIDKGIVDDAADIMLANIDPQFTPNQKTIRLITKWIENEEVNEDQTSIERAFYDYFENSIKACKVSSIEDKWISKITEMIPKRLQTNRPVLLTNLFAEVDLEFKKSNRESAVQYILKRPAFMDPPEKFTQVMKPPDIFSHEKSYETSRSKLQTLFANNHHLINSVLSIWPDFNQLLIVDINKLRRQKFRIFAFRNAISIQTEKAKSTLGEKY